MCQREREGRMIQAEEMVVNRGRKIPPGFAVFGFRNL